MRTLLSLLLVLVATACSQRFYPAADQDAIRTVWNASIDAAMRGDYDAWASAFSSDVEIVHPTAGMRLLGKNDVESVYRAVFANPGLYASIKTTRFDVEIAPAGDLAWGTAETEMVMRGQPQTTWFALVFRREGNGWKMVLGFDASPN